MRVPRRSGGGDQSFAEFAVDHREHAHCASCMGCIVDPSPLVRLVAVVWCVGCRDKLRAACPEGAAPPWTWETTPTTGDAK